MPKTTMKLTEIKPTVTWDATKARDLLIKIGAGVKAKGDKVKGDKPMGAVKCTDKGKGMIELEWSGTMDKLTFEEVARH